MVVDEVLDISHNFCIASMSHSSHLLYIAAMWFEDSRRLRMEHKRDYMNSQSSAMWAAIRQPTSEQSFDPFYL